MSKDTSLTLFSVKNLSFIALMSAVICILAPNSLAIPISPVPISFTNLAVYFTIYLLGTKKGTISYLVYLLIGFCGLPVFSNHNGGASVLFGATGGYLIGFIFMAIISGIFIEKFPNKLPLHALGMILGTTVCYLFGTAWLAYQINTSFAKALTIGVLPFIIGDLAKIVIALILGSKIRKALVKAQLL